MAVIELEKMEFYAFHGCYESERKAGTFFNVDLYIETDVDKASKTDKIEDALNYQSAYQIVKNEMLIPSNLLENVCYRITEALYKDFGNRITKCTVRVSKLNPPVGGKLEKVTVVYSR